MPPSRTSCPATTLQRRVRRRTPRRRPKRASSSLREVAGMGRVRGATARATRAGLLPGVARPGSSLQRRQLCTASPRARARALRARTASGRHPGAPSPSAQGAPAAAAFYSRPKRAWRRWTRCCSRSSGGTRSRRPRRSVPTRALLTTRVGWMPPPRRCSPLPQRSEARLVGRNPHRRRHRCLRWRLHRCLRWRLQRRVSPLLLHRSLQKNQLAGSCERRTPPEAKPPRPR